MAAGSFICYTSFKRTAHSAGADINSATMCFSIVGTGYTPSLDHSDYSAQIASSECSASITSGARKLTGVAWTASSSTAYYLRANNPVVTAGGIMTAKYALIYMQTSKLPVAYCELESGSTVAATMLTIKFNSSASAGTIFKVRNG